VSAPKTYEGAGVARLDERAGFRALISMLRQTFEHRPEGGTGRSLVDFGAYASIIDIGGPTALAMSTDGIGTKAIIAQLMDRYDTVGIDCVAMNVNDVLCVGAEPVSMLDYIAVETADDRLLAELGKGLLEGARQARISIPGGEISQMREVIRSERPGFGFDLAGTCVGLVNRERIIVGEDVRPGDAIVGLASTGIHSNGLTLAREALLATAGLAIDEHVEELGRTVGEELLEPTRIYVEAVLPMLGEPSGSIKTLAHITSDGFLNLTRAPAAVGYEIDRLPEPPAIFRLLQEAGGVAPEEMFQVYNMGIGFCAVCAAEGVSGVIGHAKAAGVEAWEIGRVVEDERKRVWLREQGLVGEKGKFARE
jgi:phosphoribosylformylglycinamidine cyclo-ligase